MHAAERDRDGNSATVIEQRGLMLMELEFAAAGEAIAIETGIIAPQAGEEVKIQ